MTIEIPGIDEKKGLRLFDGDIELYLFLLNAFVSSAPEVINAMRNVSEETIKNYYVASHRLKGNAAQIGAENLSSKAAELESLAKGGDLSGILTLNEAFINEADAVLENIRIWLKKNNT